MYLRRLTLRTTLILGAMLATIASADVEISNSFIAVRLSSDGQVGMGTTGGDPQNNTDNNKRMLYNWPSYSTFTSYCVLRVEEPGQAPGQVYFGQPFGGIGRITTPPQVDPSGEKITMGFNAMGIDVLASYTLTADLTGRKDTCEMRFKLTNNSATTKNVGWQVMLDTMIGDNDGAPINLPNIPFTLYEQEYTGTNIPPYWYALEGTIANPGTVVQGTLRGAEATNPDRFGVANYFSATLAPWTWVANPATAYSFGFLGDSAIQLFWNLRPLAPGQSVEYVTYYGLVTISSCASSLNVSMAGPTFFKNTCIAETPFDIDVQITNTSNTTVADLQAVMILDPGLVFAATGQNRELIRLPNLPQGQTERKTFTVKANSTAGGNLDANLFVTGQGGIYCQVERSHNLNNVLQCTPGPGTPTFTPTPPGPTWTPTPTPSATPITDPVGVAISTNQTEYRQWDTMRVNLRIWNNSGQDYPVTLYVVVELAGQFYFYPTFSTAPVSVADFTLTNGLDTGSFELLRIPFADPFPTTIPATWYAAMLNSTNSTSVGNLSSAACSLRP